ncbi:MAG TPA: hypothetical protein VGC41_27280, partial [Kofleriaceae bacterium]
PYVPPAPPQEQPRAHTPSSQPYQGGLAPNTAPANAATLFVNNPPPAMQQQPQQYAPPQQFAPPPQNAFAATAVSQPQPYNPVPQYPAPVPQPMAPPNPGIGVQGGPQYGYNGPIPAAGSPQYQARSGNPVEPWKDSLPLVMIVWGVATLVAFATPVSIDPLRFNWDSIIHGEGTAKVPMLTFAAMGLLGVVIGAIPMAAVPRGILSLLLGLATVIAPLAVTHFPTEWQVLAPMIGLLLLVPGLLIRNEYTESIVPRLMVTFGVIGVLLPFVVPENGNIPLVGLMKALLNGSVHGKEIAVVAEVVFSVLCLLVWMPGPATAGGKIFAWIWMLAPLIVFAIDAVGHLDDLGKIVSHAPGILLVWVFVTTAAAFISYGLATVIGKQLE